MNLFEPASNDQSLVYLSAIFQGMNNIITGGVAKASVLGTMFETFNTAILTVGALIVVYTVIVGVLKTAQEGEFLGKHWNSLWVPLRTVIGIAALVPSSKGYCAIQIVMMWIIVQGIGAADQIWNSALGYKSRNQNIATSIEIPGAGSSADFRNLFNSLACNESAALKGETLGNARYYCKQFSSTGFCQAPPAFESTSGTYRMGPGGACGTLSFCNQAQDCAVANSSTCQSCQAQQSVLGQVVPGLAAVAKYFVQADYEYRQFYATSSQNPTGAPQWIKDYCDAEHTPENACCVQNAMIHEMFRAAGKDDPQPCKEGGSFPQPALDDNAAAVAIYWTYYVQPKVEQAGFSNVDFIGSAATAYTDALQSTANQDSLGQNSRLSAISDVGWLFAGAYYYELARTNNAKFDAAMPRFSIGGVTATAPVIGNPMSGYVNNYAAANKLTEKANAAGLAQTGGGANRQLPTELGPLSGDMSSVGGDIMKSFTKTVSGQVNPDTGLVDDPLAKIQVLGRTILIVIEVLFFVLLGSVLILGILSHLNVIAVGTGLSENPLGGALTQIYFWLVPLVLGFMGLFAVFGGTLAVYTPLVPYILFTFGAIGWFISVIEAMVAAPLVAIGILLPGGHHEIMGRAEAALMMTFGIFLRPALMVFGMIAGMLLAMVVVTMINAGFYTAMMNIVPVPRDASGNATAAAQPSLLELIFFMAAYVSLIIAALNKSFSMIHVIPDRVLTWIGGQAGHGGDAQEALGESKGSIAGAAGGAQTVAGGGAGKGGDALGAAAKRGAAQRKNANVSGTDVSGDKE